MQGWNVSPGENALAYFYSLQLTNEKSFLRLTPGQALEHGSSKVSDGLKFFLKC